MRHPVSNDAISNDDAIESRDRDAIAAIGDRIGSSHDTSNAAGGGDLCRRDTAHPLNVISQVTRTC